MLRNFESVLVTSSIASPKPIKERSSSMRNIKPTTHSDELTGFDRVCSTSQRLRQFVDESLSKQISSLFVLLPADEERQCESVLLEFCKNMIERSQAHSQQLKLSIWDMGEFETDATTRNSEHINCYDVQFLSEVRRLLSRRDSNRREEEVRLYRFQFLRQERLETEVMFMRVGCEVDSSLLKDRVLNVLLKKRGKMGSTESFFQQNHVVYLMLIVGERGRTKHNRHVFQFCLDVSDRVLEYNRRTAKKSLDPSQCHSQNKQNVVNASNDRRLKERNSSGLSSLAKHNPSNPNLLLNQEQDSEGLPEDAAGRTMSLIAMKRKEGFDRLLLQLEQQNRQLKLRLTSQKNDFDQQTEEYVQKNNRKVGRLKLQIDELQEALRKCQTEKEQLQSRLQKADEKSSTRHEQTLLQLERERTELRSQLAYAKRTLQLNASEYDKQTKIYEEELDTYRVKIDCLQNSNNERLRDLEKHLEDCLAEHTNIKELNQRQEEQLKAVKQNEAKYLEEISRLEYRFLKERGKYIAEKNNNQKLAHELEVMDDKLHQIIEIKNREITDLTDESSDCH